jgi:uncharacterized protein (DUF1810 family)
MSTETSYDAYHLQRFVDAQAPVYATVCDELRQGKKESHWMWFIFPQIRGLGRSHMAQTYAIASRAEAAAYLAHPVLGPRLTECVQILLALRDCTAEGVLGSIDAQKLCSSMTLFAMVSDHHIFDAVLHMYFDGQRDSQTEHLLADA